MASFIEHYKKIAGEWNDEAGTKAYALEMILKTLQKAGPAAITDTELFKKAIPDFTAAEPVPQGRRNAAICRSRLLPAKAADRPADGHQHRR